MLGIALAFGAGLALLLNTDMAPAPQESPPPAPPPGRTLIRIAGEVLDSDGAPIGGATVYLLPKASPGADRDKVDHEVSDAEGQWELRVPKTIGRWIGAVARGYRTAWIDGNGVDVGHKIIHVLERSPALDVTIVDADGQPMADAGVLFSPWPPAATWFCPGPDCRQGEQWGVTDAEGRASFRQDLAAPLVVTPFIDGYHGHPGAAWLPDAGGTLRIVVHRNASIDVALETEVPLAATDGPITTEWFEPDSGERAFAFTLGVDPDGHARIERGVRPGTWHVAVSAPGRPPVLIERVVVPEDDGTPVVVRARLEARAEEAHGRLVVKLQGNVAPQTPQGRLRPPLVFLRRIDGPWTALAWQPGAPESFDRARQRLEFHLPPGTHEVLLADVLTGRAAYETGITVERGEVREVTLAMRPGQFGAVPELRSGDVYVRDIAVRDAAGRALPTVGCTRDGRQRFHRTSDLIGGRLRDAGVVLGPYPSDEFNATFVRSDGSTIERTYP
ncbi:MAG: carboxypeptidase-like regulatory domain-containing protein [Planctomycetota bacterium]|nr:carboxypeptidase-like regulatory domain-containing protein [Planctomycetota bacterium]